MKQPLKRATILLGMALPVLCLAGGCEKEKTVRAYEAPKEGAPAAGAGDVAQAANLAPPAELHWNLPATWAQVPPSAQSQRNGIVAAIRVDPHAPSVLLKVSQLGQGARDPYPNIVRWAGIFHMPVPPESDAANLVSRAQAGDLPFDIVDMSSAGPPPQRLLSAIYSHDDSTWIMTLSGPAGLIAEQKSAFDEFVRSIRFEPSGVAILSPAQVSETPHAPSPGSSTGSAVGGGAGGARWTLPAGWTADPGDGGFRVAMIHPSGNGPAEIKVSKLKANAGSPGMNVTRWHGDVGLGPVDDAHADPGEKRTLGQRGWTVHDYTGPLNGGWREIIALTDVNDTTWYFKFYGPAEAVGQARSEFDAFLATVEFNGQ